MRSDEAQSDPHDPADEALDRLLAQARWEEPSPESERRLAVEWAMLRHKRQGSPILWTLAAAASVAVMVGSSVMLLERLRPTPVVVRDFTEIKYLSVAAEPPPRIEARDATLAEQWAMYRAPAAIAYAPAAQPPQFAAAPATIDLTTRALLQQLGSSSVEERLVAARALGRFDRPEVVAVLVQMVRRDECRREALIALRISKNPDAAKALAGLEMPRAISEQLAADTRAFLPGI